MATQHWTAHPGAEEVTRLRHAVCEYAASQGVHQDVLQGLALAVTEIVSNAVLHAFPDDAGDGTITVMASCEDDELVVEVVDDGTGLRPRGDSPGAGLGLAIASSVARRVMVECPERGGTEVRMVFAATG